MEERLRTRWVVFLDRFSDPLCGKEFLGNGGNVAVWKLDFATVAEINFVMYNWSFIRLGLEELGLGARCFPEHSLEVKLFRLDDRERFLSVEEVKSETDKILQGLRFDYLPQMELLVREVAEIIKATCPFFDRNSLDQMFVKPSVPFNEEWSKKFDIAFQGGGAGGNEILYPDANRFSSDLLEYCDTVSVRSGRVFLEFWYRCWRAPAHEVVHCLQTKLGQQDPSPLSWSAEFDASYLAGSLLFFVVHSARGKEMFGDGLWEEILLVWVEEIFFRTKKMPESVIQGYEIWKSEFGLESPGEAISEIPFASFYVKDRLALESFVQNSQDLHLQLEACFGKDGSRQGDVTKFPKPKNIPSQTNFATLTSTIDRSTATRIALEFFA